MTLLAYRKMYDTAKKNRAEKSCVGCCMLEPVYVIYIRSSPSPAALRQSLSTSEREMSEEINKELSVPEQQEEVDVSHTEPPLDPPCNSFL